MKKVLTTISALTLGVCMYTSAHSQHQLVKLWETDSVLKVPESVLFDAANKVLYVANIDGTDPWAKDGVGSIGKVGADGKVIAAEWVNDVSINKDGLVYVSDSKGKKVFPVKNGVSELFLDNLKGPNGVLAHG